MPGIIQIDDMNQSQALIGNNDEHLKAIEESFDVVIHARGQEVAVKGTKIENVEKAESVLINLLKVIDLGNNITIKDVEAAIKMAHNNTIQHLLDLYDEEITKDAFGKTIRAKTMGQRIYVNASPALCALINGAITFLGDTRRKRIPTNVPIPT